MRPAPHLALAVWPVLVATLAVACAKITIVQPGCAERIALEGAGPEDLEFDARGPDGPRLIVSVQERRVRNRDGVFHYRGHILDVPVTGPPFGLARPFQLVGFPDDVPLHPHGIFLLRTVDPPLLYVVNHATAHVHRVEVFAVAGRELRWKFATPPTELVRSPNDVVAVAEREIYVTNMTSHPPGILQVLELLLGLRTGTVVRFKDHEWTVAASGIAYANGIAVTSRGDRILVAGTRDQGIHVFRRDTSTGALIEEPASFIRLGKGVDNLSWEHEDTTLIAARHPKSLRLLWHARTPDAPSPSEVLRVYVEGGKSETLYGDPGQQMSAASVGVVADGWLYIGQVFDEGVLRCRIGPPSG